MCNTQSTTKPPVSQEEFAILFAKQRQSVQARIVNPTKGRGRRNLEARTQLGRVMVSMRRFTASDGNSKNQDKGWGLVKVDDGAGEVKFERLLLRGVAAKKTCGVYGLKSSSLVSLSSGMGERCCVIACVRRN